MNEKLIYAFIYVNDRYVYNAANYPLIRKLNKKETKVFAIQHTLLHMQKSLYDFLCLKERGYQVRPDWHEVYATFTTKMLVNLAKAAETLGFTAEEFAAELQKPGPSSIDNFVQYMGYLAAECEKFDHHRTFNDSPARLAVAGMLNLFYTYTCPKSRIPDPPLTLGEIVENIPNVMTSK